jgi:hypothetical protein
VCTSKIVVSSLSTCILAYLALRVSSSEAWSACFGSPECMLVLNATNVNLGIAAYFCWCAVVLKIELGF